MLIYKSKDTKKYVKPMSQALSLQKVRTKDLTRKPQKLKKKKKNYMQIDLLQFYIQRKITVTI